MYCLWGHYFQNSKILLINSQCSSCGTWGGWSGIRTGSSVFPSQYHSTNSPYSHSFIHHSSTLNNLSNQVVKTCPAYLNWNNIVFKHPLVNHVKKNKLDAQLILSIFRQPLHVSGVSRPIIRMYNRMYTTVGTYYSVCCPGWIGVPIQPGQQTVT